VRREFALPVSAPPSTMPHLASLSEARRGCHHTLDQHALDACYCALASGFLVSPRTISRWLKEATREPAKQTIGCLVKAVPPRAPACVSLLTATQAHDADAVTRRSPHQCTGRRLAAAPSIGPRMVARDPSPTGRMYSKGVQSYP